MEALRKVAKVTEGFSGRQLSKLVIAWQAAAFGSIDNTLDHAMMLKVLDQHLQQQEQKGTWLRK
jgi:ATPase family AAA domain-containing protein 3A/B